MRRQVLEYLREHNMARPGDRLALAVSGGADSVAMLRIFLELAPDCGSVLSVLHFHHGIRGSEADADQHFVADLARNYDLPFHHSRGDAPAYAREHRMSLESAARELRYAWFKQLLCAGTVSRIATAHTLDDQAETLLMRLLRGAGTRGLAGIYPVQRLPLPGGGEGQVVRPLLNITRAEVLDYLRGLGQPWREDASNLDPKHTRNRIRHELLPLLARDYNPSVLQTMARTADLARAEEDFWAAETARMLPLLLLPGKPVRGGGRISSPAAENTISLNIDSLLHHPLALRRRLLRAAAAAVGLSLDAEHVEQLLAVAAAKEKAAELPQAWTARRSFRELRFVPPRNRAEKDQPASFSYPLTLPGTVRLPETGTEVSARLLASEGIAPMPGYNFARFDPESRLDLRELVVRNWQAGDRLRPPRAHSEKKVKELLQKMKVPRDERLLWPVVACGNTILWMRGQPARPVWLETAEGPRWLAISERPVPGKAR